MGAYLPLTMTSLTWFINQIHSVFTESLVEDGRLQIMISFSSVDFEAKLDWPSQTHTGDLSHQRALTQADY